jgi:hypothetical protein
LHETASHFESFCTIYVENNSDQTRISRPRFFSVYNKCRNSLKKSPRMKLKKSPRMR